MNGPYALYLGKLAPNKGTASLVHVIERSGLDWPVIIAGDGPEREAIARDAARSTRDIRFVGWVDQPTATAWLAHASLLLFPSRGPESLSRVLIEASALGIPIAAMNTGGTPDIVVDERTGLLSRAIYVERGTTAESVIMRLADKRDDVAPYFSVILVPGWETRA